MDPLVWAKTVAPVGVSFNKGMPSPSGLGTPFFHLLDVLLGREAYSSTLGKDSRDARKFFPVNWTRFLEALAAGPSVQRFVLETAKRSGASAPESSALVAAWAHCVEVYAGWEGMLGKHLQKTYGFLELAFKSGREQTLGGFSGGFRDRM